MSVKKIFSILVLFFTFCIAYASGAAAPEGAVFFRGTFFALLPPVIAILLALLTKEIYFSLFSGILLGGCLAAVFSPFKTMDFIIRDGLIKSVQDIAGILIFLVLLGIMVCLISKSGAAAAFGRWAQKNVKSRKGAILATFFLGILIFIDDYFNCLTVGGVMRPLTDSKKVSRAKLAYIIDATAAPICMVAPVSSWAAAVSQYAEGTQYSGLQMFIMALPYNFYSWLTLIFIFMITLFGIDFGPMKRHEYNAMYNNDLFSGRRISEDSGNDLDGNGSISDMIVPIFVLIAVCVFALVYVGGIFSGKDFITAFGNTDALVALPWGALVAVLFSVIYLLCRKVIKKDEISGCISRGFIAMVPAMLILTLATALKNVTNVLQAKEFIARVISDSAPGLAQFLPAVIFLVACGLAFSTGTSWGTFGILIPIVCGIFPESSPLLFIGISACLAGAVCGDHCSPISDTTVMSSAGAQCDHIVHVSTQLPYVLFVAAVSFAGFLLSGVILNWFVVFPATVLLMILGLLFIKYKQKCTALR